MISKYSVRRPYTVLVGVILVIVLGVVSLMKMTTDLLPDMSFQYALVVTTDIRLKIGRAVQQECRDRSRMPSSA